MSLLGHLWILSVLVVPLVQVSPEMIISVRFKDCSFFYGQFYTIFIQLSFTVYKKKYTYRKARGTRIPSCSVKTYLTLKMFIFFISMLILTPFAPKIM